MQGVGVTADITQGCWVETTEKPTTSGLRRPENKFRDKAYERRQGKDRAQRDVTGDRLSDALVG